MASPTKEPTFDYMFKMLLVGSSKTGKTTFLTRYCDDVFNSAFDSTVGIDFKIKNVVRYDALLHV